MRNDKLKVLDLFSGIGGFSLGLERTGGFETVAFCEIEPYPRAVLAKHWPSVPCHADVRNLTGVAADVICGGFPCQDISLAGKGAGLQGGRSGLWSEFHRLISEIKPRYAIIENVSALRSRGLDEVLRSLAEIGYDAEWHCIPASAVGLPHRRDRVWIVAYPQCPRREGSKYDNGILGAAQEAFPEYGDSFARARLQVVLDIPPLRNSDGLSVAMERRRLQALGNAIVPQIAEIIGHAILAAEGRTVE